MIPPVEVDFIARGVADVSRAFDTIEQRCERFEGRATRAARTGSRERIRTVEQEEKEKERAYRRLEREIDQLDRKGLESTKRTEREKTRATERAEAERMRIRIRSSEAAGRIAAREAAQEFAQRRRMENTYRGAVGRGMSRFAGGAALLGGAVGIGGGFLLADAMRERATAGQNAALLVNAVTTGTAPPPGATIQNILGQATQISRETGMSVGDVTAGGLEYARKARGGDFKGIQANLGFFAKMANVTGADIKEIAAGAGTLQSQNQDLDGPAMRQMLLDVYAQGKAGSMSMVDVAKQMGVLGSTRTSLLGDQATNQRKLLAMGQIAAPGGSVEEAGTFVKDMVLEAGRHQKELSAMGVQFKGGKFDLNQMIEKVFTKSGNDVSLIGKLLGGMRGGEPFREMAARFDKAGGGQAGVAAVMTSNREVQEATMSMGQLDAQNAQLLSDPAKKFEVAVTSIKDTLMTSMEPALTKVAERLQAAAPEIEKIIEKGGELASWLAENPMKAAIGLLGTTIAKDVAAAAIGESIKKESIKALGGMSIATLAVTAGAVMIMQAIDKDVERQTREGQEAEGAVASSPVVAGGLQRGVVSIDEARDKQAKLKAIVDRQKEGLGKTGALESFFSTLADPFGHDTVASPAGGEINKDKLAQQQRALADSVAAYDLVTKAIEDYAKRINTLTSNTAPGDPGRNVPIPQRGVH